MADTVHYLMEQMVPELEDLERRGLFKKAEIKQIVKKRQDFEYLLKRRRGLKEDYLRYIDSETKLEALRQHRKNLLLKQLQADNARVRWRSSLSDHAITRRIMFIYERASRKFKGDLGLWFHYLEYCRSKSGSRQMQKVLTKALQLHPARPALWIYAAAWEFEANQNAAAARSLMQRGLRMCPKSGQLWLEYLKMELTYAQRLKTRREILGLGGAANQSGNGGEAAPEAKRQKVEESRAAAETSNGASASLDQLGYKVAAATFQNTIASVPDNLELRVRFLEVLEGFDFDGLEQLEEEVYASIERDFASSEDGRACLALRWVRDQRRGRGRVGALTPSEARGKTAETFREALEAQATPRMAELYAAFLDDCIQELSADGAGTSKGKGGIGSVSDAVDLLLKHLAVCRERGLASEPMTERHVALLLQRGDRAAALETAAAYCEGGFEGSARMWVLRLGLETSRSGGKGEDKEERLDALFERGLRAVPLSEVTPVWSLAAERASLRTASADRLLVAAEARVQSGTGSDGKGLACALVDWTLLNKGLPAARRLYSRLLALPGPGLALYKKCIQLESLACINGAAASMAAIRPLFEAALEVHSQAWELWLEYCKQEMQSGQTQKAAALHWRAKKALHDPSPFLDGYKDIA
ncbi:U3 small nucleolar RNA-associated protein 6 [Klebsormidium nitens]|uniref:U3 small nucleolar RNA-associated protein 6 n=1 Tax=Klebsormidium nitens TaxID=105231 RepID=A0A1Y1I9D2_KLENI|nr:U3 small nucleolar RNA-associated protein 6 [Klebsormidium nitens]|eukprot:GAQ85721.1 U3 small nucleolar RNA-associated protein 6 [Klebsormidium nitens]